MVFTNVSLSISSQPATISESGSCYPVQFFLHFLMIYRTYMYLEKIRVPLSILYNLTLQNPLLMVFTNVSLSISSQPDAISESGSCYIIQLFLHFLLIYRTYMYLEKI